MISNRSLLLISFLLAVAIVYIKGQERIQERTLNNIQVLVENPPPNIILPSDSSWPRVRMRLQGPVNTVQFIRPDTTSFRINLEDIEFDEPTGSVDVILTGRMVRTNLDNTDRERIQIIEESIRPRQVRLVLLPYEMGSQEYPPLPPSEPDELLIPLYLLQKTVPIMVPSVNEPGDSYRVRSILVDPPSITLTGSQEELSRIDSVSTIQWDLAGVRPNRNSTFLNLTGLANRVDVRPVDDTILGVSATVLLEEEL